MSAVTASRTAALAVAVESSVMDPCQGVSEAYSAAQAYMSAVPDDAPDDGNLCPAWDRITGHLETGGAAGKPLRDSEISYLKDRAAQVVLAFAFHLGDLAYDWRR